MRVAEDMAATPIFKTLIANDNFVNIPNGLSMADADALVGEQLVAA